MSVDQLPSGRATAPQRGAQLVRYDEFIDKQIDSTRRLVKTVDVMTALLMMATGTLGFLLTAAIVEHWLVPGGFNLGVRLLLFVALVGGLLYFAARRLWPLVAGSINPAYAAHTIEQDNPSLKNSLLNLLLFRQHRDDVTDAVYETLEEQAAKRLTRVPIDAAVDRTQLLRLGYVLVAIVAAVALYKIFSPKDPFITAERVLMPWARIVPPSRVSIENVEPGAVTLARGEVLTISADVRGIGEDDPVVIKYTTADGQAVDRPAQMTPTNAGLRFTGQLPPASDGAKAGVAQNLKYRIEAGDARSLEYAVNVVAAPTITVERIDYDYPAYTLYVDRTVERLGDIRAIEGTRVTIHARANGPIEEAAVDFEADGRRDVRLDATGSDAHATFTLELREDRRTPLHNSYVLRFTGSDGRPNRDPVKFPIDVTPDQAPEVSITSPAEKSRDVRLDETVGIEVDAIDSDFALADVRLHGESAGKPVLDEKLLAQEHTGRFRGRLLFTPIEHNLKSGDVVRYWITARDNRTPAANETSSDSQTLRIVGDNPKNQGQRKPNQNGAGKDRQQQQEGQSMDGEQQQGEGGESGGQGAKSSQGNEQGESSGGASSQGQSSEGESASADKNSDQQGEQNAADQSGESNGGDSKSSESSANGNSSGQSKPGAQSKSGDQSTGEGQSSSEGRNQPGGQQQQPGESSETGEDGEHSEQNQSQRPGGSNSGGNQNAAGDSQSQPGENNQQGEQSGQPRDGNSSQQNGERQPGTGEQPKEGGDSSPVSSEGDNDGEAFERIRDFLKGEGQLPKESNEGNQESQEPQSESGESASGEPESEKSESGESASADGKDATKSENATPSESGEGANDSQLKPDAKANGESRPGESPQKSGDQSQKDGDKQTPDGQHTSSEGESGAGQEPKAGQGSPESQQPGEQPDKWQQKPSGDKSGDQQGNEQDAPSGGRGDRKNDSQGNQGGDRSGGGEEGAGQKSEREGTGSSGQNQSADEGAGESSEKGAGENSSDAGEDATSNERTGQPGGDEKGAGSSQREGKGEQPGGTEKQSGEPASSSNDTVGGDQSASSPSDTKNEPGKSTAKSPESPSGEQQQQKQPGNQSGSSNNAEGAGKVPEGVIQPSNSNGTAPDADAANLEYARKQTDLVLETLDEQAKHKKVDKRMLDKLGWTEADLKRFLDRWQQLKAAARDDGPVADDAQRELDDALRSLGLRRGQLQQSKVSDDTNRDLNQGFRGSIPLEYQERLRAYNQGVSRAQQADE